MHVNTLRLVALCGAGAFLAAAACDDDVEVAGSIAPSAAGTSGTPDPGSDPVVDSASRLIAEGRDTFRYDTFGDEVFWGDTLKLHQAIAGEENGGVGAGVSPVAALELGLKVDAEALPADV